MDDAKRRAQFTYDAAAEFFDDPALGFWDRFGRATVDRLDLHPGDVVLDACAGSGASAIPAAVRVGPHGRVVAVDLADNFLALGRIKAERPASHSADSLSAVPGCAGLGGECGPLGGGAGHRRSRSIRSGTR